MSKMRKHISHQYKVNLFGLLDKVKALKKPRKTRTKAYKNK